LAIRTASQTPGIRRRRYRDVPMAFEVVSATEDEETYDIVLSYRPQGDFTGTPGQEHFIIAKHGEIILRQVLFTPKEPGSLPILPISMGVIVVGIIAAVGAVFVLMGSGGDSVPIVAVPPTETLDLSVPTPTRTAVPIPRPQATRVPVAEVKASGTLNHGVSETGIFQGHPTEASSPRVQYMSSSVGEGLVTIGQDLQPNPMIATSWDVSEDFLEWTWKIRDDVEFHKGYGNLTTEDVIYSMKGFYEGAKLSRAGILGDYYGFNDTGNSSTKIIDDYTYVVTNTKPWVPMQVNEFSRNASGVSVWMVSKIQSEEVGVEAASTDIASTGPWEVVSHEDGVSWKFKAVEDHWRQTPYFEELIYWSIPEESARVAGFQTGNLDIFTMAFDSLPAVEAVEGAVVTGWENSGQAGLNFYGQYHGKMHDGSDYPAYDCTQPWVSCSDDVTTEEWAKAVTVRKAMNIAIDRQTLVDELLSGFGRVQSVRDWMGHDHRQNPDWNYDYDPVLAKQMIDDAGYGDGFEITLTPAIRGAPAEVESCHAVANYWEQIGISVKIQALPYATLRPELITRNYNGITCLTVSSRLSPIIGASNYTTDSTYSYGTHHPWLDEHIWDTQRQVEQSKMEAGELEIYNWIWEHSIASSLYVHDGLWPAGSRIDPDWRPTDFSDMKAPSGFEYVKHR
jgi:ABC-type transport system substrate-binding protein